MKPWFIFKITALCCIAAAIVYIIFFFSHSFDTSPAGWGQLGDYIGGVIGTIVATSTVIFLIFTINSQNKTKNDNFFFYLLQLHTNHVDKLIGNLPNKTLLGRNFIRYIVEECRIIYQIHPKKEVGVEEFVSSILHSFNTYISHNEEIIHFLQSSTHDINPHHSVDYKKLYLAQLSNDEKILIGYFCAFNLLKTESLVNKFYRGNSIKQSIDYETHIKPNDFIKPDAIKEILDLITV